MSVEGGPRFSVAVIGNGMFGSSAGAELARQYGNKVAIIGPKTIPGSTIPSSSNDSGRIQRTIHVDEAISILTRRTFEENGYKRLESETGKTVVDTSGYLFLAPPTGGGGSKEASPGNERPWDTDVQTRHEAAQGTDVKAEKSRGAELLAKPYVEHFAIPSDTEGLYEWEQAGTVNPRELIEANNKVAEDNGAQIYNQAVTKLQTLEDGGIEIETREENGDVHHYQADKVLVAAGDATNYLLGKNNLPENQRLAFTVKGRSPLYVKLTEAQVGVLKNMPAAGSNKLFLEGGWDILPPIQYPDGEWYIKIAAGGGPELPTKEDLGAWFRREGKWNEQGRLDVEEKTWKLFQQLFPKFFPQEDADSEAKKLAFSDTKPYHSTPCSNGYTSDDRPMIDMLLGSNIGVVAGGSGGGAKFALEAGRLAANMIVAGKFVDDKNELPPDSFKIKLTDNTQRS